MEDISVCYRIDVVGTDKFYIGSTCDFLQRMSAHKAALKHQCKSNPNLQILHNAGFEMVFSILETGTRQEMYDFEQNCLEALKDNPNLLNVNLRAIGGLDVSRHPHQEMVRFNKSLAVLAEKNPMYGKTHSAAARDKISEAAKGHTRWLGKTHTSEAKQKISEHASTRTGARNPFFGKTHSEEFKRILGERKRGTKPTNSNVVIVDGIEYQSQADAAKALSVSVGTINFRIKSNNPKFNGYVVIKRGTA